MKEVVTLDEPRLILHYWKMDQFRTNGASTFITFVVLAV